MSYNCDICVCSFVRKQHYDRHLTSTKHIRRIESGNSMFQCKDCKKTFAHASGLSKHKRACKYKANETLANIEHEMTILEEERDSLKEELKQLKAEKSVTNNNTTNNNTTNNNTTNNNITINLNTHGKENIDYLSQSDLMKSVSRVFKSVPDLIWKIYFNPNHPENHNVIITDRRSPYINVFTKDKKWKLANKRDTIGSMIDSSYMILDETFENNKSEFSTSIQDGFKRFQDKFEKSEKKTMKEINKEVHMVIMNGPG